MPRRELVLPQERQPVLEARELRVDYSTRHGIIHAVKGVDLKLLQGERLGVVGESGSGKSTTGWALLRLVPWPGRIVSGQVLFRGESLLDKSEHEIRRIRGSKISLITQSARAGLNPLLKVGAQIENVYRAHVRCSRREARARVLDN
jgi:ABC-type dipeptide/oligopeptide/nickel transport system ATPase component